MTLAVARLRVTLDGRPVVSGVDLTVERSRILAVIGPSGSGKTTILRAIAGLIPSDGAVAWDGRDLTREPPHRRQVGLMFQDDALFAHRTVAGNVAFGPRVQGWSRQAAVARVTEVLELVGLGGHEARSVTTLSGGERQRVALARALAPRPHALLLDEPLGALDRPLRERLAGDLRDLVRREAIAAVYVTHDQHEALAVADSVAVLRDGRIVQSGPPQEVWRAPASEWVARFLGYENIVERGGRRVLLLPDAFRLDQRGAYRGVVTASSFRGDHHRLRVSTDGGVVLDVVARWAEVPVTGDAVRLAIARDGVVELGAE